MKQLALLGGSPVREKLFPAYNTIGREEMAAAQKVLESGVLSQFLGAWHEDFYGGPKVREFEAAWAEAWNAKFAVSVNSNTSGLIAAVGAAGVGPGDEVVVSPYTMSASAIAPMMYGAVPVFADIDPEIFCISPQAFRKAISPRTKAIIVVHIFGHAADMDEILKIAREHKIIVIEDAAQAPGGTYKGRPVGVLGDMGVFSLNYHKHIHTGEGGLVTTNNPDFAERLQLIRNHGENIVGPKGIENLTNVFGYNFRLPEMEAAIGIEQLKRLPGLVEERIANAEKISKFLAELPGMTPPKVSEGNKHVYYLHANKFDKQKAGISRETLMRALKAELPSAKNRETTPILGAGYVRPLYLSPIFQKRAHACSFNCPKFEGQVDYSQGLCPVTERMHFEELFTHEYAKPSLDANDLADVFRAFEKVFQSIPQLQEWERKQAN